MARDDAWPTGSSELLALAKELNDRVTALRERAPVAELENEKFQQIIARLKRMQLAVRPTVTRGKFVLDFVADGRHRREQSAHATPAANDDGAKAHRYARRCGASAARDRAPRAGGMRLRRCGGTLHVIGEDKSRCWTSAAYFG